MSSPNYPQMVILGSGNLSSGDNSFLQAPTNKSYERLLGETIDANQNASNYPLQQAQYPQYFSGNPTASGSSVSATLKLSTTSNPKQHQTLQ